jgi:SAM-dependent methyltransferase
MLLDDVRNCAYRSAINRTVRKGDVVLDAGAGTGILSLFAAQAGAKRVYAVEKTAMAGIAQSIVHQNGYSDRVTVLQQDLEALYVPEAVDVIISEWLGTIGVDENLLAPVLAARDRCLKTGGKMLPARVTAWMVPLSDETTAAQRRFYSDQPYGLNLSMLFRTWPHEVAWASPRSFDSGTFLDEPQAMWTHDLHTVSAAAATLPFRASLQFTTKRAGALDALALWFHADLGSGISLENSPTAPLTHWLYYALPICGGGSVPARTSISVQYSCIPASPGFCHNTWSVRVGNGPWEHHDTRCSYVEP